MQNAKSGERGGVCCCSSGSDSLAPTHGEREGGVREQTTRGKLKLPRFVKSWVVPLPENEAAFGGTSITLTTIKQNVAFFKIKLSYRDGSTNNLHRHMRTVHPTVQLEEMREASVPRLLQLNMFLLLLLQQVYQPLQHQVLDKEHRPLWANLWLQWPHKNKTRLMKTWLWRLHKISSHLQWWRTKDLKGFLTH